MLYYYLSDAELENGKMQIRFQANKMFMSGKASGIKYNRRVYNAIPPLYTQRKRVSLANW
jgi:hypothetical protein